MENQIQETKPEELFLSPVSSSTHLLAKEDIATILQDEKNQQLVNDDLEASEQDPLEDPDQFESSEGNYSLLRTSELSGDEESDDELADGGYEALNVDDTKEEIDFSFNNNQAYYSIVTQEPGENVEEEDITDSDDDDEERNNNNYGVLSLDQDDGIPIGDLPPLVMNAVMRHIQQMEQDEEREAQQQQQQHEKKKNQQKKNVNNNSNNNNNALNEESLVKTTISTITSNNEQISKVETLEEWRAKTQDILKQQISDLESDRLRKESMSHFDENYNREVRAATASPVIINNSNSMNDINNKNNNNHNKSNHHHNNNNDEIREAMKNIKLDYVPSWAKNLPSSPITSTVSSLSSSSSNTSIVMNTDTDWFSAIPDSTKRTM